MNSRVIMKWLPQSLKIGLTLTMFVASLSAVVWAQVIIALPRVTRADARGELGTFFIVTVVALLLTYGAGWLQQILQSRAIEYLTVRFKAAVLTYQVRRGRAAENSAAQQAKNTAAFQVLSDHYFQSFFALAAALTTGLVVTIYLLTLNWWLGLIFVVVDLLPTLTAKALARSLTPVSDQAKQQQARFDLKVADLLAGLPLIKNYMAERPTLADAEKSLRTTAAAVGRQSKRQATVSFGRKLLVGVGLVAVLICGILGLSYGWVKLGTLLAVLLLTGWLISTYRHANQAWLEIRSTQRMREYFAPAINFEAPPLPTTSVAQNTTPLIRFDHVEFENDAGESILKNLNFQINFGRRVLVTGPAGAGKTTLLKLVHGHLNPTHGEIQIETKRLTVTDITKSSHIAIIPQVPFWFHDSLRFNLTLGQEFKTSRCQEVLTQVGLWQELGADCLTSEAKLDLALDQRQRLAIARALIFNKQIILFDEPTAKLTVPVAEKLQKLIWQLPGTIIEVADPLDPGVSAPVAGLHYEIVDQGLVNVSANK